MSVMNTFSGKKFDPMHMNSEDVSLEDLAHALSLLCRGGGHLKYFYSVGQHSINCMKEARARGWSKRIQLACLLHDASEAYIADIIRPVKAHLPEYYKIESKIMTCIFDKFGLDDLSEEENSRWKQIDDEILDHELRELMIGEKDRPIKPLASVPDMAEQNWRDVAEQFKTLAEALIRENSYENCRNKEVFYL